MTLAGDRRPQEAGESGLRQFVRSGKVSLWLLRIVALVLIAIALQYWIRLTGVREGANFRFDTMPGHFRLASTFMAVALPVTALGLWSGASWGIVLWLPAIAIELLMYGWFSQLFGTQDIRLVFHLVSFILYCLVLLIERLWLTEGEGTRRQR